MPCAPGGGGRCVCTAQPRAAPAPTRRRNRPPPHLHTRLCPLRAQTSVLYRGLVDGKYTVSGELVAGAPAESVYALLTDYAASPAIFDNISSSAVSLQGGQMILSQVGAGLWGRGTGRTGRTGRRAPAHGPRCRLPWRPPSPRPTLPLAPPHLQGCRWKFLVFGGEFKVDFTVREQPEELRLAFQLQESSFMRHFEGRWQLERLPSGATLVRHQLAVMPFMELPAAVEGYVRGIFSSQVSAILADLQAELERREGQRQG